MKYQWHVFLSSLDPIKGSEQAGRRPVLVISREEINQLLPVVKVIPLTSRKSHERVIYPNGVLLPDGDRDSRSLGHVSPFAIMWMMEGGPLQVFETVPLPFLL